MLFNFVLKFALLTFFYSNVTMSLTVIQVRGSASYKTRFNPPFSAIENACTKSRIWQLLSIRLMCFIFWFCHLIKDFPFWIFLEIKYFCYLIFFCSRTRIWNTKCYPGIHDEFIYLHECSYHCEKTTNC